MWRVIKVVITNRSCNPFGFNSWFPYYIVFCDSTKKMRRKGVNTNFYRKKILTKLYFRGTISVEKV